MVLGDAGVNLPWMAQLNTVLQALGVPFSPFLAFSGMISSSSISSPSKRSIRPGLSKSGSASGSPLM